MTKDNLNTYTIQVFFLYFFIKKLTRIEEKISLNGRRMCVCVCVCVRARAYVCMCGEGITKEE
jgi:hypothetical protein